MKIISFTKAGYYHIADKMPNQDAVFWWTVTDEINGIVGIIVADGCSSETWSNVGSSATAGYMAYIFKERRFLKKMAKYLNKELLISLTPDTALFDERYEQALRNMICSNLKEFLGRLLEKYQFIGNLYTGGLSVNNFATTMTMLFIQCSTGKMTSISVGDGFACVKDADEIHYIAFPENKGSSSQTYFITDDDLDKHLKLNRYESNQYAFILVSTDGLCKLHKDRDSFLSSISFSEKITSEAVKRIFFEDKQPPDDIGFVLVVNDASEDSKKKGGDTIELHCIP